ncbi:MAG: V-type ATP synthase subunit D [Candidatus Micrarchaeota archaeon]|nr:V-type ATP synthase subunit D [Candidatus Micrarchaeota archaeon]MDE1864412.1 V-type ATP synthase subunit D [Candidatus Micrarchaeota archaeon]
MKRLNPTRMNLLITKRMKGMAKKGHDILERKKEVLVIEFMKLLQQSKNDRSYLYQLIQKAYKSVAIASTYVGDFELEKVAAHVSKSAPVRITLKNIMGVRVPEISRSEGSIGLLNRGYSIITTSTAVDDVSDSFQEVENAIIDIAKREQGLKRIVIEIDKTKRRVNALEYVIMPGLDAQRKYIAMRLEEVDRDMFSALKHVKKRLAKVEQ